MTWDTVQLDCVQVGKISTDWRALKPLRLATNNSNSNKYITILIKEQNISQLAMVLNTAYTFYASLYR